MKTVQMKKMFLTSADGSVRDAGGAVSLRFSPFDGGYACYVSGKTDFPLSAEAALTMLPDWKDDTPFLSLRNQSDFWCGPEFGKKLSALHQFTLELLFRDGDDYLCFLPVCSANAKTVLRGTPDGAAFVLFTNCDSPLSLSEELCFLCVCGKDPHKVMEDAARRAAELLGNGLKMRSERKVAPVFEKFGWCSWDALQIRVNHQGLLDKAAEFKEKKVPVGFAIIDDMWADVPPLNEVPLSSTFIEMVRVMHASKLRAFSGDPKRFPKGMKAAISDLKAAGIPSVGVWFPATGYWSGLEPGFDDEKLLSPVLVTTKQEKPQRVVAPEKEKAKKYYGEFCRRIRSWGGDFVKIDNQGFMLSRYKNIAPLSVCGREIHSAIDETVGENFGGALINCMGMPSECMFNRPASAVSRCSDDFIPESREWFAKNILQCSYNGLLQGQYYVNDWDMWWTDDEQAKKNSLCRAVSGGPIYVSDKQGRTNPEILRPLLLADGSILRPDESATPTSDCMMEDPTGTGKIFKIRNRVGKNGLIAVFNIDAKNRAVAGSLSPADAGLPAGKYAYYEYFTKSAGILAEGEKIDEKLANNDEFRLYTFIPMENGVAFVGRTDLFIGVKAVTEAKDGRYTLCEGGEVAWISEDEMSAKICNAKQTVTRKGVLSSIATAKKKCTVKLEKI